MPIALKDHPHRILLLLTGLMVTLLGIATFCTPPGADPDPSWGFMIMHSMERGGGFNLLVSPSVNNIAQNRYEFLSWWSPGQYMVPLFFKTLFGINTGKAVALTIAVCSLLGLSGFYRLFKQLGFSKWIATITVMFISSQLFFILPFTYYTGGELLLFAFLGWFLYACISFKKITWRVLTFIFFAGLAGFFFKSSFLWMYAASVTCIWINISVNEVYPPHQKPALHWIKNALLLAVPFVCALILIYVSYLSKGGNPASDQAGFLLRPETFSYPLASPITSGFSIDELLDGLIYQPDKPSISHSSAVIVLLFFSIVSLAYMFFMTRLAPNKKYPLVMLVFYFIGAIFFSYMYLKQATISYEGRHFRIIGLLFLPGFVYLCFKTKITRVLFFLLWIFVIYKAYTYSTGEFHDNSNASRGNTGLSQQLYDKPAFNAIIKLDHEQHNAIFVVMSSDIAAEVYNNRVITFDEDMPDEVLSSLKYHGNAGPVYILMPAAYLANGRKDKILNNFLNYHNFETRQLSKGYYLYSAKN